MRVLAIICVLLALGGCAATAVKDPNMIKTNVQLLSGITAPTNIPVVYYIDKNQPDKDRGIHFIGKLREAAELVVPSYFSTQAEMGKAEHAAFVLMLNSTATYDNAWGNWKVNFTLTVKDPDGSQVYRQSVAKSASGAGLYDFDAVYNSYAAALKETLIGFLNSLGSERIAASGVGSAADKTLNIDRMLDGVKPQLSGSGFFVDTKGTIVTAAHVVDECVKMEAAYEGSVYPISVNKESKLLDLAVLNSAAPNKTAVIIPTTANPVLGQQIFVTGFPLSDILSPYPSLTVGNLSSFGSLKGGKGLFQFTAPIQPGSSGGAIVDYSGNLMGVVSSTLNQKMMLEKRDSLSQNVNFGVSLDLFKRFLDREKITLPSAAPSKQPFERASAAAVEYTVQVRCYQ